jgi:uncharacterized membrane protein
MSREIVAQSLSAGTFAADVVRAVYAPALITHTAAGVSAILAGISALVFRKGEARHKLAGRTFVVSMLLVGLSGPLIAQSHVSFLTSLFAAYFVATAWRSASRGVESGRLFETGAFLWAVGLAACFLIFGLRAAGSPTGRLDGYPASFHYFFAGLSTLAAAFDLRMLLRAPVSRDVTRHLIRMCLSLGMASLSFFFGQQDRFPPAVRRSGVLAALVLAPFVVLLFWFVRVRFLQRLAFAPGLEMVGRGAIVLYWLGAAAGLLGLLRPRGI